MKWQKSEKIESNLDFDFGISINSRGMKRRKSAMISSSILESWLIREKNETTKIGKNR